ncbi:GIMA1 GTPase, partial [Crypturellus soui]|nr:GIMA1 GTPase [Crypturellus soui]
GSLHGYVMGTDNVALQRLIRACGNRYCAFNNRATRVEQHEQVTELLELIQSVVEANSNSHYTIQLYSQASSFGSGDERDFEEKCRVLGEQV